MLFLLFIFLFNIHHAASEKNTGFHILIFSSTICDSAFHPLLCILFFSETFNAEFFLHIFGNIIISVTHLVYVSELLQMNIRWSSEFIYEALATFPLWNNRATAWPLFVQEQKIRIIFPRTTIALLKDSLYFRTFGAKANKKLLSKTWSESRNI